MYMVCPNCGHEIKPGQNFCENCGLPLKKEINVKNNQTVKEPVKTDAVRSLSDLENELDEQEKLEQAKKTSQPQSTQTEVDDKTRVYDFRDSGLQEKTARPSNRSNDHIEMAPGQKAEFDRQNRLNSQPKPPENLNLDSPVHLDPVTHLPIYPDDKTVSHKKNDSKNNQSDDEQNEGLLQNMTNFLRNNIYVDIMSVILFIVLFFVKRNYSWILLAVLLVAWFLTSQIIHGKEIRLNKIFTHHDKKETSSQPQQQPNTSNYQAQNPGYNQQQVPNNRQQREQQKAPEKIHKHRRTWAQNVIMISAIVSFIASITGPFVNNVSLTSTIASAANYGANQSGQSIMISNVSSAVRFICFISPVIVLIAANFRSRGSIRLIKTFTILPSIIYVLAFALFSSNIINASLITGVYVTGTAQIGTSFYILIITSLLSMFLSYTLRPRQKN